MLVSHLIRSLSLLPSLFCSLGTLLETATFLKQSLDEALDTTNATITEESSKSDALLGSTRPVRSTLHRIQRSICSLTLSSLTLSMASIATKVSAVFCLLSSSTLYGQQQPSPSLLPRRNLELFDSLALSASAHLAQTVKQVLQIPRTAEAPPDTLQWSITPQLSSWLVEQYLPTAMKPVVLRRLRLAASTLRLSSEASKVSTSSTSPSVHPSTHHSMSVHSATAHFTTLDSLPYTLLTTRLTDCAVRYFRCDHDDNFLTREVSIILTATLERSDGEIIPLPRITASVRDTIARRVVSTLESRNYDFTTGSVPEPVDAFWSTVLEPVIVVGSAIITLILLFTVRTQ
jgi:hypothetical protein